MRTRELVVTLYNEAGEHKAAQHLTTRLELRRKLVLVKGQACIAHKLPTALTIVAS